MQNLQNVWAFRGGVPFQIVRQSGLKSRLFLLVSGRGCGNMLSTDTLRNNLFQQTISTWQNAHVYRLFQMHKRRGESPNLAVFPFGSSIRHLLRWQQVNGSKDCMRKRFHLLARGWQRFRAAHWRPFFDVPSGSLESPSFGMIPREGTGRPQCRCRPTQVLKRSFGGFCRGQGALLWEPGACCSCKQNLTHCLLQIVFAAQSLLLFQHGLT